MPQSRSFLESLASFDDPAPPQDLDPEDNHDPFAKSYQQHDSESNDDIDDDQSKGREHYADVGEGGLREKEKVELGDGYAGEKVGRRQIEDGSESDMEGEEDDDEEGEEDEEMMDGDDDSNIDEQQQGYKEWDGMDSDRSSSGLKSQPTTNGFHPPSKRRKLSPPHDDHDENSSSASDINSSIVDHTVSDTDSTSSKTSSSQHLATEPTTNRSSKDRAHLRSLMSASSNPSLTASLSAAARTDRAKGIAVIKQRRTFDELLNLRIKLQKGLIAANGLGVELDAVKENGGGERERNSEEGREVEEAIQKAEQAALKLWNQLDELRTSLSRSRGEAGSSERLRKVDDTISSSTPLSTLRERMSSQEALSSPYRDAILTKWSNKVNPVQENTGRLGDTGHRLGNASNNKQMPLTSMLHQQLQGGNLERLIAKARVPGGCVGKEVRERITALEKANGKHRQADLDNTEDLEHEEDAMKIDHTPTSSSPAPPPPPPPLIYDDTPLYTLLLRSLISSRSTLPPSSSTTNLASQQPLPFTPLNAPKIRKRVDTKASKGRKIRYNVHEKLQDFMKGEDLGVWGERQRGEFFGGLFGGGGMNGMKEKELKEIGGGDGGDEERVEGGFRLFG